jgi:hypothetical protein
MVISGQRFSGKLALIRIVRALVIISSPDRSAAPFWPGVYGAEYSTVYPLSLI